MATKNLGQASAIISKTTAPTNTKVIWRDTSVVPAEHKVWNGTEWIKIKLDFFTELKDVPNSYISQAGKVLIVKLTEDGLEFGENNAVEEAPNDGQQYVRQSEGWAVITIPNINPTVNSVYTNLGATPSFDLATADVFKRTANIDVTTITDTMVTDML